MGIPGNFEYYLDKALSSVIFGITGCVLVKLKTESGLPWRFSRWLRSPSTGGKCSIPCRGIEIPHATGHSQNTRRFSILDMHAEIFTGEITCLGCALKQFSGVGGHVGMGVEETKPVLCWWLLRGATVLGCSSYYSLSFVCVLFTTVETENADLQIWFNRNTGHCSFFTSAIWGNDILLLQKIWTDLTSLKLETSSRVGWNNCNIYNK